MIMHGEKLLLYRNHCFKITVISALVFSVNIVIGVLNVLAQSQFRGYQFTMILPLQKNVLEPK